MKIVFHGENAASFRPGFEALLNGPHEIVSLSDGLDSEAERDHFRTADVIVGIRLNASMPRPERLRLYQAPAAGVDQIERDMLPPGATLCNAFGHEDAIAEYVMTALLLRHVPLLDADARLRQGDWRYWAGRPTGLRTELGGSTIGLLGFGHIGKAVGIRAKAFGMRVTVATARRSRWGPAWTRATGWMTSIRSWVQQTPSWSRCRTSRRRRGLSDQANWPPCAATE